MLSRRWPGTSYMTSEWFGFHAMVALLKFVEPSQFALQQREVLPVQLELACHALRTGKRRQVIGGNRSSILFLALVALLLPLCTRRMSLSMAPKDVLQSVFDTFVCCSLALH